MNNTAVAIAAILALACTAAHAEETAADPPPKPLDLRAPAISKLYTHRQLERLIAKMEADYIEKIEVLVIYTEKCCRRGREFSHIGGGRRTATA